MQVKLIVEGTQQQCEDFKKRMHLAEQMSKVETIFIDTYHKHIFAKNSDGDTKNV